MISQDIQKLDPGAQVTLFELDMTALGGTVVYFHAGTDGSRAPIVWQGNTYSPWPVLAEGFEYNGRGQLPVPHLKVSNIARTMTALNIAYDDLIGAKVTRRRTLAKYLDGQPEADPDEHYPDDVYYVERKVSSNRALVDYELSSIMDVEGLMLPKRQVQRNLCGWQYRSAECSYAGGPVAKIDDTATSDSALDNCSRKVSGCKLRFGDKGPLPYGGFPSVSRT